MKRGTYAVTVLVTVDNYFGQSIEDMVAANIEDRDIRLLTAPVVTEMIEPVEVPA